MKRAILIAALAAVPLVTMGMVAAQLPGIRAAWPFRTGPGWLPYTGPYQFGDATSRKSFRDNVRGIHTSYDGQTISDPIIGDPNGEYSWPAGQ